MVGSGFQYENAEAAAERLMALAMRAAESDELTAEEGSEYTGLRLYFLGSPNVREALPAMVLDRTSLRALAVHLLSLSPNLGSRQRDVMRDFNALVSAARTYGGRSAVGITYQEGGETPAPASVIRANSSAWTGIASGHERVALVRTLAPPAMEALEQLIVEVEASGHNGGPALEERVESIKALRALHQSLGELIAWADRGGSDPFPAIEHVKDYLSALASDVTARPVAYLVSGILASISAACGFGEVGGWLSAAALCQVRSPRKV